MSAISLFERMRENRPTFVYFKELQNIDYPKLFTSMKSAKRGQDEIDIFANICMKLKQEAMTTPAIAEMFPLISLAVEKDEKVWFFELMGVEGQQSPMEWVEPLTRVFNPNMFVVLAESWYITEKAPKGKSSLNDYAPGDISKSKDRHECLIVDGRTRNGDKSHVILEVKRGKNNNIRFKEIYTDKVKEGKFNARYDMDPEK